MISHPLSAHISLAEAVRRDQRTVHAALRRRGIDREAVADAWQDACLAALRIWPADGVPNRPAAWLLTAARRAAIDAHRRRLTLDRERDELVRRLITPASDLDPNADPSLRVLLACSHPSLSPSAGLALALHVLFDLRAPELAPLLGQRPGALAQQLVRAKRTLRDRGAVGRGPRIPAARAVLERIERIRHVLHDRSPLRRTIAAETRRLSALLGAA